MASKRHDFYFVALELRIFDDLALLRRYPHTKLNEFVERCVENLIINQVNDFKKKFKFEVTKLIPDVSLSQFILRTLKKPLAHQLIKWQN